MRHKNLPGLATATDIIFSYHQDSKHHLNAYAKGPDTIDWSAQPVAFRHYSNTAVIDLPFIKDSLTVKYDDLFILNRIKPQQLTIATLAGFFELSMGLSAWKQYGTDRWAQRCNPSSGNLHPTEAYALLTDIETISDGIYHYCSDEHQLEQRGLLNKVTSITSNTPGSLFVCLSSIHWREAWKYGERAFRYSQLDIGHAIAALRYAAACFGWSIEIQSHTNTDELDTLFGFDRPDDFIENEKENAEVFLKINTFDNDNTKIAELTNKIKSIRYYGKANILDNKHFYDWPVIDSIETATRNPGIVEEKNTGNVSTYPDIKSSSSVEAATIIRQRRSAQHFDNTSIMSQDVFYQLLDKILTRKNIPPFDLLHVPACIHPILFIHRVDGLAKGLYALPRNNSAVDLLKTEMRDNFLWQAIESCPSHIPLYKLILANSQNAARTLFCQQDIAADSAFSMGMLAEFKNNIIDKPWQYRDLFWEAGILGQSMYLEAEAHNFRATGIGCFYDDNFHELLGLKSDNLQSLYHFTVGTPIVDNRLVSLSPYAHIQR